MSARLLVATFIALAACQTESPAPTSTLEVAVAPLTLPGLGKACYDLRVTNASAGAGDVVWARGTPNTVDAAALCSDRYGAGGGISYVGPCDASGPGGQRTNSVTVWVDSLYDQALTRIEPDGPNGWRDPCPNGCTLDTTCRENADSPVAFDLTILRDANQGFFDVAVTFDDLFCSAKVDCQDEDGPLMLLFDPVTGQRRSTIVSAFACTGGPGADVDTVLYRDPLVLTCGADVIVLDPSAGPGNAYTSTNPDPDTGDALWQYAVYAGQEALSCGGLPCNKVYWNVALGLDTAADNCRLTTAMTASDGPLVAFETPAHTTYPFIELDLGLTDTAGLVCTRHALNAGVELATDYTSVTAPESFAYAFDGQSFSAASYTCTSPCQNGGVCTGPNTCTCVGDWQGATCTELVCPAGSFGAAPPSGDGVCRPCTALEHCASGLTCTSANDSTCGVCQAGYEGPTCTPIQTSCDLVEDGLVFALDADEPASYPGSGTTWTDLVRGIDCTLNGQAGFDANEGAIVFNGTTNTYAGCGTAASPQSGTTQLTVSFWVKKPSASVDALVSTWRHDTRQGWFLQWFSDGNVYFGLSSGGVNNNSVALPWTNGWYHITGVFDGTNPTAINRIYVNGVERAATSLSQLTSLPATTADLRVGGALNYGSWSSASFGAVTVYNRALSAAEVLQNFQSGRSACSPRTLWDGTGTGPLDTVTGASAGYSVRALRAGWTSPLMRVRRADNATIDIHALGDGNLDVPTLTTFAGASDVFLSTWYDQSGAGHHAAQATSTAQPKIVAAGAPLLVNGRPALVFDGANDHLPINTLAATFSGVDKAGTFVSVHKLDASQYSELLAFGNTANDTELFKPFSDDGAGAYYSNRRDSGSTLKQHTFGATALTQSIMDAYFTGTSLSVFRNGAALLTNADLDVGTVNLNTFTLGAIRRTATQGFARVSMQEVLLFPADKSASRSTLQSELAAHYGVQLGGLVVSLDAGNAASYPGSGSAWTDLSGFNNHATLVGAPTYQTQGGGNLTFTGTNHGTLGNVNYNRSAFSVFGWVRMNVAHTNWAGPTFSKWYNGGGTVNNEWSAGAIGVNGPSPFGVAVQTNLGILIAQDTVNYTVGAWNHIGFTWDHGSLRFYRNGALVGSANTTGTIPTTTQPLALATFFDLSTYRTRASIATMTLHNRALSPAEIQQAFEAQRARFGL